ncbi:hypothetical protein FUAX_45660 (plasmid) [Fulvitalea axinellae]|uniref:HTH cro/C1-type domain-containing protein n=1 Tax=Fulvitalea axinellae TaxID=1182444 RepID=A0AAU9CJ35_9BACT|nr:hypothetical protein FUAX_45660 [Fulvitalea axinellae]
MGIIKDSNLSNIGKVIKEIRLEKGFSLQELGNRSDVTPGLLSKIENFRTIPSIPVLFNIAKAMEVEMKDLVREVTANDRSEVIHIRKGETIAEEREDSEGLTYFNLLSQSIPESDIRVNLVEVDAKTYRPPVATDCLELIYLVSGQVHYGIRHEDYPMSAGDTLYFDGSLLHSVENKTDEKATLFKIYFMNRPE